MEYTISFAELNSINDNFFGIDPEEETSNEYAEKVNICNNFEDQLIDKLTDLGKNDDDIESALKSFMENFKEELEDVEDCTVDNLKDYFSTILSAIDKMNEKQIIEAIKSIKNNDLESLFNVFGGLR